MFNLQAAHRELVLYVLPLILSIAFAEKIGSVRGSPSGTIGNFTDGTIGSW